MYYYQYADGSGAKERIYSGTVIYLHKDYKSRITNSRYLMVDPAGWLNYNYCKEIEPVYETTTDYCTAPTSLAIDTATKVMTITGGGGGDLNAFTAFGVSWRERSINSSTWGAWSEDEDVTGRTVSVAANAGRVRQYRVRTKGSAGSTYYSGYTVASTLLNGNSAAGTPTVEVPSSGAITFCHSPTIRIQCPADPDGDMVTLKRSIDSGAWTDVSTATGDSKVYDHLSGLTNGTHTVRYKLVDTNDAESATDSVSFTVTGHSWGRAIAPGDVISNEQVSHRADIEELLAAVNSACAFYSVPDCVLEGVVGVFGDWRRQMEGLEKKMNECLLAANKGAYSFAAVPGYPAAGVINEIRDVVLTI